MRYGDFSKTMILTFLTSAFVTVLLCFVLPSLNFDFLVYIAPLCGLYIFSVYSMDLLIDDGVIQNNYFRVILALICIILYIALFVMVMPMVFDSNVILPTVSLANFGLDGLLILEIFALIMLLINIRGCLQNK